MAFQELSALRKSKSGFEKLKQEVENISNPKYANNDEDKFWQPEVDKAGNGYAVIRFLAAPKGEDLPFVRTFKHGFQGPSGKWYIEESLTTIGKADPVSEYNSKLWNTGTKENQDLVRKQKRKLSYIANILIVSDSKHPENEGKVFLFKFGSKIFDKVSDVANPKFEDETAINPFDFWEGANFKLKIRNVEGYRNYDKSEFDSPSAVADNDEEIEKIWNSQHSLTQFLDPSKFKSYDELKARFESVIGGATGSSMRAENVQIEEAEYTPPSSTTTKPKVVKAAPAKEVDFDNAEESLDYFANLASDD
jgi:hypothetical protein